VRDVDTYSQEELKEAIRAIGLVSEAGNPVSDPFPFNLMFGTQIGPSGHIPGFLRPETAQGIFVNFKRLLDFNGGRLPFGAATIGQAFRNEIAPRSGLLRVREFTLAEIEYFVHPDREHRRHAKFALSGVKNLQVPLLTREAQAAGGKALLMTLGDAVDAGVIDNETLAYFIGRTAQFLIAAGLTRPLEQFRFRQHRANEMAHYANDCWDAEIFTSYGFVECVGIADRSCYDLTKHSEKSKVDLVAYERFETPVTAHVTHLKLDKAAIGKQYKKAGKAIEARIEAAAEDEKRALAEKLAVNGQIEVVIDGETFVLTKDVVQVQHREEKVHGRNFIPSVIEPSFGLGRILYSLLENAYYVRAGDDEQRAVLGLSPLIAPYKCVVLPLSGNEAFGPLVERVRKELTSLGISCKVDDSGSAIGRRYARSDEIGIPFGVTVDFQSVSDLTVTLRERDSCTQVRLPVADVGRVVRDLSYGNTTWAAVRNAYPEQAQTASELVGKKE
jgi:glycyl-tRNA synthetase